jgi:redox-sensitive bicupin YhaK (pirin superfamily)
METSKMAHLVASGFQLPPHPGSLPIHSPGRVFSCFLQAGQAVSHQLEADWGAYLYLLEEGPIEVGNKAVSVYGSAMIRDQVEVKINAGEDSELLIAQKLVP